MSCCQAAAGQDEKKAVAMADVPSMSEEVVGEE